MFTFVIISVLFTTKIYYVEGQLACRTPSGAPGHCMYVNVCAPLAKVKAKENRTQADTELLRQSECPLRGQIEEVCCPDPCHTPDGKEGQCVNVYDCKHLASLLRRSPLPEYVQEYVKNSRCEGPDHYSVCCGPPFTDLAPPVIGECGPSPLPPTPTSECCGVDSNQADKLIERCNCALPPDPKSYCCGDWSLENAFLYDGGNDTAIDEYPWLALIEYQQSDKVFLLCGASLISARYVLTAGHCVKGEILNIGKPTNVRLGEYDTSNDGPDCVAVPFGGQDCNEGITVIRIESIIAHPEYKPYHAQKRHDIALIRLSKLAPYTEFIRPICLPTSDLTLTPENSDNRLWISGWGAINETVLKSFKKLHVDLPYVPNDVCQASYQERSRNITLTNGVMCAGGEANKDSCRGDSGGPLMLLRTKRFEIVGIISFGPKKCGLEGIPGVYTKVYEYNTWMRSVMKP